MKPKGMNIWRTGTVAAQQVTLDGGMQTASVTFPITFANADDVVVCATPDFDADVYVTGITTTGCTLNTDVSSYSAQTIYMVAMSVRP